MNIITISYNSNFYYIRPDTSLNRDSNDYFCPDHITEITVVPFIYIRFDKAGKSISTKFASRYYTQMGYGLNLAAQSLIDPSEPFSFSTANSLDNTTYISTLYKPGLFPAAVFSTESSLPFDIPRLLNEDSTINIPATLDAFHLKLEQVSRLCSVKTGDLLVMELCSPKTLPLTCSIQLGEIAFSIK